MKYASILIVLAAFAFAGIGCVQNLGKRDSSGKPLPLIPANVGKERIDRVKQVKVGMTLAEVQDFIGVPADRQTRGQQEAWLYCQVGITDAHGKQAVVVFRDGRVISTDSIVDVRLAKPCRFAFYPIKWNSSN